MINLSTEVCRKFKEARKAKGLNQSALAQAVGCQQSAVSMFEGGMVTKLSDETVRKMASFLGVELIDKNEQSDDAPVFPGSVNGGTGSAPLIHGYCPNCNCPSNVPYVVDGRLFYRPSRMISAPTGGTRCVQCGEILEQRCPMCGAPLNDGACCAVCGSSYVTPVLPNEVNVVEYARLRREEIIQLRALAK